ncbi:TIGR03086 family protein [Saccharopolyspora shandongensis]|uniref:TIGR03086 family protein n=1 Tax=Saccharopolyspora shandongensis TaxID=418495 RepID=A0A1H3QSW4_9PSEU|nr:TIGR03086 family metal-binding protein [Saccharopolyspora shandongensis]SDZ16095.1 TIGR03086 family protein [Saccharopolyspora shandongensis]
MTLLTPSVEQLGRVLNAVGRLVSSIREGQWSDPTPCTDWTVKDLVNHLVDVNLAVAASLKHQAPPEPGGTENLNSAPVDAYVRSSETVRAAFDQPRVLELTYQGPFGETTGAALLHVRLADLLTHGWDLARATGQPVDLPEELAEQALAFVRRQFTTPVRTGRFDPAQAISEDAPAIDRLAAFLGRPVAGAG